MTSGHNHDIERVMRQQSGKAPAPAIALPLKFQVVNGIGWILDGNGVTLFRSVNEEAFTAGPQMVAIVNEAPKP